MRTYDTTDWHDGGVAARGREDVERLDANVAADRDREDALAEPAVGEVGLDEAECDGVAAGVQHAQEDVVGARGGRDPDGRVDRAALEVHLARRLLAVRMWDEVESVASLLLEAFAFNVRLVG